MNNTSIPSFKSLGEQKALQYLGEIIDSKILFAELESRKMLHSTLGEPVSDQSKQPTAAISAVSILDIFANLEILSRTMRFLELFKIKMCSDNVYDILSLLDNDKFLSIPDKDIEKMLKLAQ